MSFPTFQKLVSLNPAIPCYNSRLLHFKTLIQVLLNINLSWTCTYLEVEEVEQVEVTKYLN